MNVYIVCIDRQGLERLAAVLIEFTEVFQTLQTQIMDVAAQQVQREVESIAGYRHEQEEHHVPRDRAERIEDRCNDRACQHQGHQSGIGKNVAEVARHMVVDRAEDRRDLAEALRAPAGADHDHRKTHVQNDVRHAERHARDAREHDPPGKLFPDGVHDLPFFDLLDEADGHAGHDLDKAERHGADQNRDRVVERGEERGERLERRVGVDDADQLRQEIAEEAARQAEFERREQELARKREETWQRAKANVEATREAEENASKVEVPVRPSKKKPTRGLKHVWIDVVGAVGIGAVLLIMGYNFFLGGMFTKKEEPASSEESSAAASASSKADSAVVVELPAAASMSESESASSEEPASTNIPESSSVSSSSVTVSSGSAVSSSSVAVASGSTAPTAAGNSTAQVAASASTEPTTDSTIQMVTNQTYQIWGTYTGEWENDAPTGLGKINFFNGDVYEGQWKDGIMSGQGKYTYANGDVYEGDFQNSSKSGQGKYSYANGSAYEGQWKNDLRDGWGVMKASDGTVYEGEWKNGKTSGQGKMTLSTGDVYEGSFQNGHISGQGTMTYSDGTIKSGTWKNDEFVG